MTPPARHVRQGTKGFAPAVAGQLARIEQLRQENAALKQRIEQMEWER
jgi:cell division protein FtsB